MTSKFTEEQFESLWNKAQSVGMTRREFLKLLATSGAAAVLAACAPTPTPIPPTATATLVPPTATPILTATPTSAPTPTATPTVTPTPTPKSLGPPKPATYAQLPRWRGFNLPEKFRNDIPQWNKPYDEWDLDFMVEWGFDFVRLPTDYRIWTVSPGVYGEQPLKEIDQVISWARQRGIHVNLCLHRAPGYCVNPPKEPLDLWADGTSGEEARRQFAAQWRMFAARYRDIQSAELSFNLVNEPPNVTGDQYVHAVAGAIAAIREEDPERLIIADGADYGRQPVPELVSLKVAQSTRGYEPFLVSHYRASWFDGSENWPIPTWPIPVSINQFLYGNHKPEFKSALILRGHLSETAQLSIKVHSVSAEADLVVRADGATLFEKSFKPGPGQGEWKESVFRQEWNIYQAVYDKTYTTTLPAGTREIQIEIATGDWLTFSEIRINPFPGMPTKEIVLKPVDLRWGVRQEPVMLDAQGNLLPVSGRARYSKETLWTEQVEPWKKFAEATGTGVHVGEWGAYSYTPHGVVLAWMKDCLENWKQAGMGWALWNLRGSFGPLDSGRSDVVYENYKGHKLDRKMFELLRQS